MRTSINLHQPIAGPRVITVDRATGDRLNALWEAVRATWPAERASRNAIEAASEAGDDCKDLIWHRVYHGYGPRNQALGVLGHAVLQAAGYVKVDEDRWEQFGVPLAVIRVGCRLFVVSAGDQADFPDEDDDEDLGLLSCVVVDLDEMGGIS